MTVTNDAADPGGAGLLDMKVWNDGESQRSAQWRPYAASAAWELRHEPGMRTVNVRLRDAAMPPNVSKVYSASITLSGSVPAMTSVTPQPACVGEQDHAASAHRSV